MKALSIESTFILDKMVVMMEDFCIRIDNSEGVFLPVYVAIYDKNCGHRIISVGHYTSTEGEITADPEMRFLRNREDGCYYPTYYRQDILEVEQETIKIFRRQIKVVNKSLQAEHVEFAGHAGVINHPTPGIIGSLAPDLSI